MNIGELSHRATVLVVDDTPDNLTLMSELLRDSYKIKVANSGRGALRVAFSETPPDLILLDIMMPDLSGYDVIRELKSHPTARDIPVIFLTAMTSAENEQKGLELGAIDYITKPISAPIVLARVANHLRLKEVQDFLRSQTDFLIGEVSKRTKELSAIQDVTILVLASLAETRDSDTGNHIRRTQFYVKALAEKLQHHPRFGFFLRDNVIDVLFKSAPLHDIGKVGIPDHILLKPGRFTPEEFEIMKTHPRLGLEAIQSAEDRLGMKVDFLKHAKEITYCHHEKWDGSGYPNGLQGDDIPIAARLMAVADVYDALISRRVYKVGMPHEQAALIIRKGKGTDFDPDIVDAFLELQDEFKAIALRFADSDHDIAKKAHHLDKHRSQE